MAKCLQLNHRSPPASLPSLFQITGNGPEALSHTVELRCIVPGLQPQPIEILNPTFRQNPKCGMHKSPALCPHIEALQDGSPSGLKEVPSKSPIKYCSAPSFIDTTITHLFLSESPSTGNWNKPGTPRLFTVTGRAKSLVQVQLFQIREV